MLPPQNPKIYHITPVGRLASVIADRHLWCDAIMVARTTPGTTIGIPEIKARRLVSELASHAGLCVGQCVPFYFCPRSVMLFTIHRGNHPSLTYHGGQEPILTLEADLHATVEWALNSRRRWAFTLSNAGARYFEDRCDLAQISEINWDAVHASKWSGPGVDSIVKDGKQAEFLVEQSFPWELVSRIGVRTSALRLQVELILRGAGHQPAVEVLPSWYY